MPSRSVTEYTCERCTRAWYVDAKEVQPQVALDLKFIVGVDTSSAVFKCLCEGCQKTVKALVEQITKVMKKSAPVRGAKKKPSAEDKSTAPGTVTAPLAGAQESAVAKTLAGASLTAASPSAASSAPARSPSTRV